MPANPIPSARIQRLLGRFPPSGKEKTWYPNGADERAVLLYEYFQRNPSEPLALRFANGLAHVLAHIAAGIGEDELLVGEVGLEDVAATRPGELARADRFWQVRNNRFNRGFAWHAAEQRAGRHGLCWKWASRDGHVIPAFELILSRGLGELRQGARQAVADEADGERRAFRQAMLIALESLAAYIRRYGALAQRMAESEARPERRGRAAVDWRALRMAGGPPAAQF